MGEIFDKLRIQCRMQICEKNVPECFKSGFDTARLLNAKNAAYSAKVIDLQNEFNILVAKQWKIKISVPMSYMRLFENLAVLEKWYLKGTYMEPKWDLTGT